MTVNIQCIYNFSLNIHIKVFLVFFLGAYYINIRIQILLENPGSTVMLLPHTKFVII